MRALGVIVAALASAFYMFLTLSPVSGTNAVTFASLVFVAVACGLGALVPETEAARQRWRFWKEKLLPERLGNERQGTDRSPHRHTVLAVALVVAVLGGLMWVIKGV